MEQSEHFISPIWVEERPEFLKHLIKSTDPYIKESRKRNKLIIKQTKDFGYSHSSTSLLGDKNFLEFIEYIGAKSIEFLDNQGYAMNKYNSVFTELWVQEFSKNGGGHQSVHTHYNNHVSGFYFLKCSPETSKPVFYDPRPGAEMTKLQLKNPNEMCVATNKIRLTPTPGTIIIFNSYLPHEFSVDSGKEPFRFIHWNIQSSLLPIKNV